jgi:hypothetical protein
MNEQEGRAPMRPALLFFASRLTGILWIVLVIQIGMLARNARFAPHLLASAFSPDAGVRESLPEPVVAARSLLRRHDVTTFSVAGDPVRNKHFVRRLTEAAYPARLAQASSRVIVRPGDVAPGTCELLDRTDDVGLYDCSARD